MYHHNITTCSQFSSSVQCVCCLSARSVTFVLLFFLFLPTISHPREVIWQTTTRGAGEPTAVDVVAASFPVGNDFTIFHYQWRMQLDGEGYLRFNWFDCFLNDVPAQKVLFFPGFSKTRTMYMLLPVSLPIGFAMSK